MCCTLCIYSKYRTSKSNAERHHAVRCTVIYISLQETPGVALDLEAVASHACLVLGDEVGALLLRVVRGREEHALITLSFLVRADAAWL